MAQSRRRRRKYRSPRQRERITYVAAVLGAVTLVGALLWGSGVLDPLPPMVRLIGAIVTVLLCIVLLLPRVQSLIIRRDKRENMEYWRK